MQWSQVLTEALEDLPSRMGADQLAYLTATSKVEGPIRDEVAWALHRRLSVGGLRVSREWSADRRDLAILDADGNSVMELEAKALYGFDAASVTKQRLFLHGPKGHARDIRKMSTAIKMGTPCYLLSLVTQPMAHIPQALHGTMKYSPLHNAAVRRLRTAQAVLDTARHWGTLLEVWESPVATWEWPLGDVYGIAFALDCHLVGPLNDKSVEVATLGEVHG